MATQPNAPTWSRKAYNRCHVDDHDNRDDDDDDVDGGLKQLHQCDLIAPLDDAHASTSAPIIGVSLSLPEKNPEQLETFRKGIGNVLCLLFGAKRHRSTPMSQTTPMGADRRQSVLIGADGRRSAQFNADRRRLVAALWKHKMFQHVFEMLPIALRGFPAN